MRFDSIPSAWRGHEQFAAWLVRTVQPKVIVELGVDYGFSTIALARPNIGTVYAIDWFRGDGQAGPRDAWAQYCENIRDAGVQNVRTINGEFAAVAKDWPNRPDGVAIDILHIDGAHGYDAVKRDFEAWAGFVRPGGIILLHDTRSFPNDSGRFFREITTGCHERWAVYEFEHASGLGVLTKLA